MERHTEPAFSDDEIAAAVYRGLGMAPARVLHIQSKSCRSVYEAVLADELSVVLKLDDGSTGEDFRLGLEAWAMQQAASTGMPLPAVLAVDLTRQQSPFRYLISERATGIALPDSGASVETQRLAFRAAGRWLARLHLLPVTGFGLLDEQVYLDTGEVQGSFASWAVPSSLRAEAALNELYGIGALDPEEAAGAMSLLESAGRHAVPQASLLHGKFAAHHLFIDPASGALTGVIDFGDRMGGDPPWDLAIAWERDHGYPGLIDDAFDALLQGYVAETGTEVPARLLTAYQLMQLLIRARSLYDRQRLAEMPPVRRRLDLLLEEAGLL